jgi:hypothetical protein
VTAENSSRLTRRRLLQASSLAVAGFAMGSNLRLWANDLEVYEGKLLFTL